MKEFYFIQLGVAKFFNIQPICHEMKVLKFLKYYENHENNKAISKEIKELALFGAAIILSLFLGPLVISKKKEKKNLYGRDLIFYLNI